MSTIVDVSKSLVSSTLRLLNKNPDKNYELELVYQGKENKNTYISGMSFSRLFKHLSSSEMWELSQNDEENTILDVITYTGEGRNEKSMRCSLHGTEKIQKYCNNTITADEVKWLIKERITVENNGLYLSDLYNFRMNLKLENELKSNSKEVSAIFNGWSDKIKSFRFKKRYHFVNRAYPYIAIDMTIVKSNTKNGSLFKHRRFEKSRTLESPEMFEIEIELLGDEIKQVSNPNETMIVTQLLETAGFVETILDNVPFKEMNATLNSVYSSYCGIIANSYKKETQLNIELEAKSKFWWIGPQVVSIRKENLLNPNESSVSIESIGYTVTHKTDGERHVGIVYSGGLYLMDNRFNIKYSGVRMDERFNDTIFDGELVTKLKSGEDVYHYYIFDLYFLKGEEYRTKRFVERLREMNKVKPETWSVDERVIGNQNIRVIVKDFIEKVSDKQTKEICRELLSKVDELPYNTDGLIFTPPNAILASDDTGMVSTKTKNWYYTGKTWERMLKWKPPHDNTIDFLVISKKNSDGTDIISATENSTKYKTFHLYTGYKFSEQPMTIFRIMDDDIENPRLRYDKKLFEPKEPKLEEFTDLINAHVFNIPMKLDTDGKERSRCINGDVVENECIVEMYYDLTKPVGWRWTPRNVRQDKTEDFRKFGSNYGNNYDTALNIWKSYYDPITQEMISGLTPVNDIIEGDLEENLDKYYVNGAKEERKQYISLPLMKFHNEIKTNLINDTRRMVLDFNKNGLRVMELCCGKGGDLFKWNATSSDTSHVNFYIGIDLFSDGLEDYKNGACSRYISLMKGNRKPFEAYFLQGNVSLPFENGEATNDYNYKQLFKTLWATDKNPNLEKAYGKAIAKYDIVSIQFAIHYFFKNREMLHGLLRNVATHLKVGGYFIGTGFDGVQMFDFLSDKSDNGVEYMSDKKLVWKITKKYQNHNVTSFNPFGHEITVFMESINQPLTEYLINYQYLETEALKYGLRLVELRPFDTYAGISESFSEMNDSLKQLSFINRTFIFKKESELIESTTEHPTVVVEQPLLVEVISEPVQKKTAKAKPQLAFSDKTKKNK